MTSQALTIFVVDDDRSFLTAVTRWLRASGYSVQSFTSASEFLEHYSSDTPGCLIADLRMAGLSGLDLQDALIEADSPMPVIFLTGHGDIPTSVRAMRHGAEDFLTKRAPKEELLDAVKRALARDAQAREYRARLRGLRARFDAVTPREREVLAHVLQGKLNKQIAYDLGINERTVKLHRTSFMSKLQVQSVTELTRLVQEADLLQNGQLVLPET
jgi:FixJ family two-component response regulator